MRLASRRSGLACARQDQAGPWRLRLRDGPERVTAADGVFRCRARQGERSRQDHLRTDLEKVGSAKAGIEGEEFLPAAPVAKARGGKLPERVAGLTVTIANLPEFRLRLVAGRDRGTARG